MDLLLLALLALPFVFVPRLRRAALVAVVFLVALPLGATAGPLDDAVADVIGDTPAYWAQLVALISAGAALVVAVLPRGDPSGAGPLARLRKALNLFAANWGSARNEGE